MPDYKYKYQGKEIVLEVDTEYSLIQFTEPSSYESRKKAIDNYGFLENNEESIEILGKNITLVKASAKNKKQKHSPLERVQILGKEEDVLDSQPIFNHNGNKLIAHKELLIGLSKETNIYDFCDKFKLEYGKSVGDNHQLVIPDSRNLFDVIRNIEIESNVRYVEPDFMIVKIKRESFKIIPPEKISNKNLEIIKAKDAWSFEKGNPEIKIAIVDDGIDIPHKNLNPNIFSTHDMLDGDLIITPKTWDEHGTACIGLAAGHHSGIIKGVAGNCKIIGIRSACTAKNGDVTWVPNESSLANGIIKAYEEGADVINLSWESTESTTIKEAIQKAYIHGRNKKGCVIVAAVGNQGKNKISFPANLNCVIGVGATNQKDEPKTKNSSDGEKNWGSNYGARVDIAAPGVKNHTTGNNNTYIEFSGTSSSAPLVSGAAALILSAKPYLKSRMVRKLLIDSADTLLNLNYSPSGHNPYIGYGRLNILKAMIKISPQIASVK